MPTDPAAPDAVERRRHRLPDNHPAVERLRIMRAAVAKLKAVADSAHVENSGELYAALVALDDAASGGSSPSSQT